MNVTDLRAARKSAGLTQRELADLIGTDRAVVTGMETATRSITAKMGERLSQHVNAESAELVIANRLAAMEQGTRNNNPHTVLKAAKGMVEVVGDRVLTPGGAAFIDGIVNAAVELAEIDEDAGSILLSRHDRVEL